MAKHPFDPVALVFGLVFAAAGVIVMTGGRLIDEGRVLAPLGLVALGVGLLLRPARPAPTPPAPTAPFGYADTDPEPRLAPPTDWPTDSPTADPTTGRTDAHHAAPTNTATTAGPAQPTPHEAPRPDADAAATDPTDLDHAAPTDAAGTGASVPPSAGEAAGADADDAGPPVWQEADGGGGEDGPGAAGPPDEDEAASPTPNRGGTAEIGEQPDEGASEHGPARTSDSDAPKGPGVEFYLGPEWRTPADDPEDGTPGK